MVNIYDSLKDMLAYTDLKPGAKFILDGEPYVVLDYSFAKKCRQKPTVQTKIRNLITGGVVERSFGQSDNIKEADIENKNVKFLYSNKGEFWFCAPNNPKERFKLGEEIIGDGARFLKGNSIVQVSLFGEKIIDVILPVKVDLKVVEAPPAVKGNTAQGVTKQVKLETGEYVTVPIFINQGDIIRVNTEKGEYVERVSKT
ncbi:elongation factor P [Patescibacteria group bacterium]|nr:elongation factor P [Patescibacteria group bacterium]